jgi:hypothetical protein
MVLPAEAEAKVLKEASLCDLFSLPTHLDTVAFESRAAGGAVAAGVSATIAAKVASKGVFNAAAKALSKMAVSKAVAVFGGAAVGATFGSIVPGVGTVIVGALGGLLAGLAIDGTLLTLEEVISRVEFKNEILAAIQESRCIQGSIAWNIAVMRRRKAYTFEPRQTVKQACKIR